MKLNKIVTSVSAIALCAALLTVPAFASTGKYVRTATANTTTATATATYPICPKTDCTLTGDHEHDGTMYSGHHNADGHEYHTQEHANGQGHNGGNHNGGGHGGNHRR